MLRNCYTSDLYNFLSELIPILNFRPYPNTKDTNRALIKATLYKEV